MNKPVFYIILCFCLPTHFLLAQQNLVPNGSFEDSISCPLTLGDFSVRNWISPYFNATPDYYHSCNSLDVGVPQNGVGWQYPKTGNAYVGFFVGDFSLGFNIREYIQCQLTSPLEANNRYEVSFWVSRADSCRIACDNIGAYLSVEPVSSSTIENLGYITQVVSPPGIPIEDADNWTQIIDTIVAFGGESFITLGVFSDDSNTTGSVVEGGWMTETYYFIDDVSVIHIPYVQVPNVFTPNDDCVNDYIDFSVYYGSNVFVLNRWGHVVFSCDNQSDCKWDGRDQSGNNLPEGVYFYVIELSFMRFTGAIHLVR